MPRNPKVEFDMLQMYFGEPYEIDLEDAVGKVTVLQPSMGDIIRIGETRFYQTLNIFTCNTTQYRLILWDLGIDWNKFSDFELFVMLHSQADPEVTSLLFKDLDIASMEPLIKRKSPEDENGELVLWDNEKQVEINANVHNHFSQYFRAMFNTFPEEKITHMDTLKNWYINKDRRAAEHAQQEEAKGKKKSFSIQPIISACVNHPGFKYKLKELKDVGVMEFYDSVSRLQIYEQCTALMKGMYSGFVDGSKIKAEDYNFMREIVRDTNNSVSKNKK